MNAFVRKQQADGQREIVAAALLLDVGGCEVDRHVHAAR